MSPLTGPDAYLEGRTDAAGSDSKVSINLRARFFSTAVG